VAAEADSGEAACRDYPQVRPDVVVMDLSMPAWAAWKRCGGCWPTTESARILALSAHEDTAYPQRVLKAGALGYLSKRSAPEALIDAVRAVAAGRRYVDAQLAQKLAIAQIEGEAQPGGRPHRAGVRGVHQLAQGLSVAQIAENLKLAPSTVGTHLYNVKQKLNAANQAELTLVALRWGLIQA